MFGKINSNNKTMNKKINGFLTLFLALMLQNVFAQSSISGTVSDEGGPLPGVSVLIKGTNTGTETDFNGKFTLKANKGDVLIFSFIGMKTQLITVGSSKVVNVTMTEDSNLLEEVVVTAQGIKTQAKSLGYARQSVKGEDLTKTRETDISTALAGKVSGVQFTGQPSSSFSNPNIRLRGNTGVLYVVDGVKLNSSTDVNTEEIEDMTVLKGLAATALYGPDGRNGAIVITTKKAKDGESKVTVNSGVTFSTIYTMPEYQNEYGGGKANDGKAKGTPDYDTSAIGNFTTYKGQLRPSYEADESWGPRLEGQMVRHWDSWIKGDSEYGKLRPWVANPNNVRDFYRWAVSTNNAVSFSKGGEDYSIRSSISYIDQELILENSDRQTARVSINANYNLTEKLKFNINGTYTKRDTKNNPKNNYGNLGANFNQWWQRQLDINRLRNYKRNGKVVSWNISSPTNPKPAYWDSPFFEIYENLKFQKKNAVFGQIGITYEFNNNFSANVSLKKAYNNYDYNARAAWGGLNDDYDGKPWYLQSSSSDSQDEIFGILNYNKKLKDFDIKTNAGFETTKYTGKYFSAQTSGGMTTPGFYSVASSVNRPEVYNRLIEYERKAWFLRASLGYKDLLYLEGSYRTDYGSSATPNDNSVKTVGVSGSFIFTELLPKNDILSFGKLRAGYAEAPSFPRPYSLSQVYETGDPYGTVGTQNVPNAGVNPLLKGGAREELEFGTELRFLKNRLTLDVNYFERKDNNLPSKVTVPGSSGISYFFSNEGKQSSKGFEISLSGTPIKTENFTWDIAINAATLERMVDFIAEEVDVNLLSRWGPRLEEHKGKEWGSIYGNGYKIKNGQRVLKADGTYEKESNKYLGSILPDVTGGLTTNFSYKGIDLAFGFDYQFGGKFYGVTRRYGNYAGLGIETVGNNNLGNPIRNKIAGSGTHKAYSVNLKNADKSSGGQLTSGVDADGNPQQFLVNPFVLWRKNLRNIHEEFVNDATYVKLRTIRIGYTMPKKSIENTPFKEINFGLFVNNVWLIHSDVDGVDPSEIEGRRAGDPGYRKTYNWIENGQLPSTRTYGANVKFTF